MPRPPSQSQYFISHKAGSRATKHFPTSASSHGEQPFPGCPTHTPQRAPHPRGEVLATNPFLLARLESPARADPSPAKARKARVPVSERIRLHKARCPAGGPSEDALRPRARPRPAPAGSPTLTSSPPPPPSLTGAPAPRAAAAPPRPASRPRPLPARRWRPAAPRCSSSSSPTRPRCRTWR